MWYFYGGFILWVQLIINLISRSLSSENDQWAWNFQIPSQGLAFLVTSLHPEAIQKPTKSCLMTTKYPLITQEISEELGPLCQEPETENKYVFLFILQY